MNAPTAPCTVAGLETALRARYAGFGDHAGAEARALLGHVLGMSPAALLARGADAVDPASVARARVLATRRLAGEPLAYLTGRRGFWGLEFDVSPAVLVPRPDTETLVEAGLECLEGITVPRVADLGTGSGAIACALARERPDAWVLATDRDGAALAQARGNAARLGLRNIIFARLDWLAGVAGAGFDLIVSNPPYIAQDDPCLDGDGLRFEPRQALLSGPDGLDALRAICTQAPGALEAGGVLALEHGAGQAGAVRALLAGARFGDVRTRRDLGGHARVTLGRFLGAGP